MADFTELTIGFLGCGNMAECIMAGLLKSRIIPAIKIYTCNRTESTQVRLESTYGVKGVSATELASKCNVILVGVKPYGVTEMLDTIGSSVQEQTIIVSMAAGITIESMEKHLPQGSKVIRVMPNLPCFVGAGMTSVTPNKFASDKDTALIVRLFESIGKAVVVSESAIHGVIGVCGSSPAYIFMFMEALADGGVRGGLPRDKAYEMACQAVLGSAKMLQETGKTPGALKDLVCSPGGTTIEAVRYLEKGGMRSAVIEAMIQCMDKSKEMEKTFNL